MVYKCIQIKILYQIFGVCYKLCDLIYLINCNCFPVQELSCEMDFLIFASLQSILLLKLHISHLKLIYASIFFCVTQQDKLFKDGTSKNQFVKGIVCFFVYIHKTHPCIKRKMRQFLKQLHLLGLKLCLYDLLRS